MDVSKLEGGIHCKKRCITTPLNRTTMGAKDLAYFVWPRPNLDPFCPWDLRASW